MPRIIHRALHERLTRHARWAEFQEDFAALTGLEVELADSWGSGKGGRTPVLCRCLEGDERGRALCLQQRQEILARCGTEGHCSRCDLGLYEIAVAVDVHRVRIGYLICRGFRDVELRAGMENRIRHLAAKDQLRSDADDLVAQYRRSPSAAPEKLRAVRRMLVLAAENFAHLLAEQGDRHDEQLPAAVARACRYIRAHALSGKVRLSETATACQVSAEHLSRIFHQSTGLSYNEYVTRFRLEHATELLRQTDRSVTDIAHETGFQSISQFHRSFRAAYQTSPLAYRNGKA